MRICLPYLVLSQKDASFLEATLTPKGPSPCPCGSRLSPSRPFENRDPHSRSDFRACEDPGGVSRAPQPLLKPVGARDSLLPIRLTVLTLELCELDHNPQVVLLGPHNEPVAVELKSLPRELSSEVGPVVDPEATKATTRKMPTACAEAHAISLTGAWVRARARPTATVTNMAASKGSSAMKTGRADMSGGRWDGGGSGRCPDGPLLFVVPRTPLHLSLLDPSQGSNAPPLHPARAVDPVLQELPLVLDSLEEKARGVTGCPRALFLCTVLLHGLSACRTGACAIVCLRFKPPMVGGRAELQFPHSTIICFFSTHRCEDSRIREKVSFVMSRFKSEGKTCDIITQSDKDLWLARGKRTRCCKPHASRA